MKKLIGLWFIVLAICIMIIGFCTNADKDKKMVYTCVYDIFWLFRNRSISFSLLGGIKRMSENEIISMLGDIRYAMFDILQGDELPRVLLVIDEKMALYRGKSNEDIAKELIEND